MEILVPICICAVLPIAVVAIVFWTARNSDNKRAEILMKALETGNGIDADKLAAALEKPRKSPRQILNGRLLKGCIFSLSGLMLIIVGLVNFFCGAEFQADPVTVPMVFGGISLAVGASFLIVYFVTRSQVVEEEKHAAERPC